MNNDNTNYSWTTIIIALIIFWPVGLYLLIKKTQTDKQAVMASGKLIKIVGMVLCGFAAIGLISGLGAGFDGGTLFIVIAFGAGGLALLNHAKKTKKEAESVKKYLSIIVNGGERSLDAIASATGKQYDVVKTDIQKMIDKGFLKNAYLNENTREVVLATPSVKQEPVFYESSYAESNYAAPQTRVVACPCCGANNTIYGEVGECEYCGSPIK